MDIRFTDESAAEVACDLLAVTAGPEFEAELASLDARLDGHLLPWLHQSAFDGKPGTTVSLPTLGRLAARQLLVIGVGDGGGSRARAAAGMAGRFARRYGARTVALALDIGPGQAPVAAELLAAGNYAYDRYKREDDRKAAVEHVVFVAAGSGTLSDTRSRWQSWARDLVNAPADDIYPESLADRARTLARLDGVEVEVWDLARCKKEGCVGIEAVGRGSDRPGCLIHVSYRPAGATSHVALVGKGVTFDSGGLSLKPSSSMQTMRCDMGGAATMLATVGAVAELRVPVAVDCFVGAVENMTGGAAYKLGDVLTYANGVTVEIHNTDAEGRLVLADCLIQASRVDGVQHIVDAATLTGACVIALGGDFTGLFTADDALATALSGAAKDAGEGLWRMPLHQPYTKLLRADWATIKNVGGRDAGAITAALFLQHFVDADSWAHLDIAGPAFMDKETRHYAPGATGEMVRTLATWIAGLAR